MRDRSKLLIVFCIFFEVSSLYSISLTTTFQDAPPKYIDGERVSGIAFDILTSISKDLKNYDIDITWDGDFRNMGEIQKLLQDCKIDFFIGMAKTPERQKQLIFSKVPIYSINSLLLLKRGAREATKAKIGVISSTKTSKNLPKSIKDSAEILEIGNVDRAINLLLDGELDGVFYNSMSLGYYYLKHKDLLEPVLMFSRKYYQYVVFSKCVNSEVMNMVDKVLEKMIKDGKVEKIIKKYNLENFVKPPNEISIAVLSSAPYSYSDSDIIEGIEIDILKKVFKDIGYSVNFYIMNYKRALEYVKRGIMDGVVPVLKEDPESVYLSGEPLEKRIIGYAVLKNSVPKKNTAMWIC